MSGKQLCNYIMETIYDEYLGVIVFKIFSLLFSLVNKGAIFFVVKNIGSTLRIYTCEFHRDHFSFSQLEIIKELIKYRTKLMYLKKTRWNSAPYDGSPRSLVCTR